MLPRVNRSEVSHGPTPQEIGVKIAEMAARVPWLSLSQVIAASVWARSGDDFKAKLHTTTNSELAVAVRNFVEDELERAKWPRNKHMRIANALRQDIAELRASKRFPYATAELQLVVDSLE